MLQASTPSKRHKAHGLFCPCRAEALAEASGTDAQAAEGHRTLDSNRKMHILKSLFTVELLRDIPVLDYSLCRISRLSLLNEIPVEGLIEQIKNTSPHAVPQEFKDETAENWLINTFQLGTRTF